MAGDYTRMTFDPRNRRSTVYMQQGRLWGDWDKNEDSDIQRRANRSLAEDVFGRVGLPHQTWPDAFRIVPILGPALDLSIGVGRYYVNGIQIERFEDEAATYLNQPFLPLPPALPDGDANVLLRVWDREITYIEDPRLLDVALGGVDTATRLQTVWQLILDEQDTAACGADLPENSAGRLSVEGFLPPAPDDPCIVPPLTGYRGTENRTYKLKIFEGGLLGTARFMFSRDAGSIVAAVENISVGAADTTLTVNRIGRDPVMRFAAGDWVTLTDDHRELMLLPPEPAQIIDIDETNRRIVLDRVLPSHNPTPFGANSNEIIERHTKITRWDQTGALAAIDTDGLITTGPGPIDIEDGIRVSFSMDPAGGEFLTGDEWLFTARTADASVEELDQEPPRRVYHYAQVAAAQGLGGTNPQVDDCRPLPEDGAVECCCCMISVNPDPEAHADFTSLAAAVNAIPAIESNESIVVIICLHEGEYLLPEPVLIRRRRVILRGCGRSTVLIPMGEGALILMAENITVEHLAIIGRTPASLIFSESTGHRIQWTFLRNLGRNQGTGPAIQARRADRMTIVNNFAVATSGFDLTGQQVTVSDNRLIGGPVRFGFGSDLCRLENNDIIDSEVEGVLLGSTGVTSEIDIVGNRILRARRHGIASAHFDPEDEGGDGIIDGLRITGNVIEDCIAQDEQRASNDPPFSGIALGRVYDARIRDNRILRNGEVTRHACCGIYIRHSRGADITGNVVDRNGPPPGGGSIPGLHAGIALMNAQAAMAGRTLPDQEAVGFAELSPAAAAHVVGNAVYAPRGQALKIIGQGPMRILDNRFQARDVLGDVAERDLRGLRFSALENLTASVFIINFALPSWFGTIGLALGYDMITTAGINQLEGSEILGLVTPGGHTQFRGNQVRLDLTQPGSDIALANVLIACLDDTVITDNQTEGIFSAFESRSVDSPTEPRAPTHLVAPGAAGASFSSDILYADLFNIALTTRQSNNGFMTTPLLTMFSIISHGILNHCTHNQTTSCISATGTSPKSRTEGNAVLFPNPSFCSDQ
jgi:Family of unknown function (DUF6519)